MISRSRFLFVLLFGTSLFAAERPNIVWPGVTAAGSRNDTPIQSEDYLPTLVKGLGLPGEETAVCDGIDLLPALKGEAMPERPLFRYPAFLTPRWAEPHFWPRPDVWLAGSSDWMMAALLLSCFGGLKASV